MQNNTKLLVIFTFLIIIVGSGFLFIGLSEDKIQQKAETPLATQSAVAGLGTTGVLVTHVVDGDTIQIETGETVRYIGIDTPETVHPKKPVECYGKEASNKNKELVQGKRVVLEADKEDKDLYGRLLRYVYLPLENGQMLFIEDYLIREGYGKLLIIPPDDKYKERL